MTVAELIAFLQTKPQGIQVAYRLWSEQCVLEQDDIVIEELCTPRDDGWIHDKRPDKATETYLVFPGN